MPRLTNIEKRVMELEEAMQHLLEVQVKPSTDYVAEWEVAVKDARRVLRNRMAKGWKKSLLDWYNLRKEYEADMMLGHDRMIEELSGVEG